MVKKVQEGEVYGRLTVVRRDGVMGKNAMWLCRCSCGNTELKRVAGSNLLGMKTRSCGCTFMESRPRTHGKSSTRVYSIWRTMKNRCLLATDPYYARYGGRGITVCARWMEFANFYADMGDPPSDEHTLERKDNNGNYEKENCRWATRQEQANNRSTNRLIVVGERAATIAEWAKSTGLPKSTIRERLQRGWSDEEAVRNQVKARRTTLKKLATDITEEEYNHA